MYVKGKIFKAEEGPRIDLTELYNIYGSKQELKSKLSSENYSRNIEDKSPYSLKMKSLKIANRKSSTNSNQGPDGSLGENLIWGK